MTVHQKQCGDRQGTVPSGPSGHRPGGRPVNPDGPAGPGPGVHRGTATGREPAVRRTTAQALRSGFTALTPLRGGTGTALLALGLLLWMVVTVLTCLVGVGLLMVPGVLRALHSLAERERRRLSRWGPEVFGPGPAPTALRQAVVDPTTQREAGWLAVHATLGLLLGLVALLLPVLAVRDITFPLWWYVTPPDDTSTSIGLGVTNSWAEALPVALLGLAWVALIVGLAPGMARLQAWPARRLLAAGADPDLSLRVAELTATRAAALDAHATELRRIERSLHDGTQNRLVTVTVLLGAARRMVARDPRSADDVLERAQSAAEAALADLRTVARSILPPVLADRGLAGALGGLAASCPVECRLDIDVPQRCAASVEATAYFVVAEALTNVARHSRADKATVTVASRGGRLHLEITDDGRGGAEEIHPAAPEGSPRAGGPAGGGGGSGLLGIRRRVAAHDGTLTLTSPSGGPTTLKVDLPCGS